MTICLATFLLSAFPFFNSFPTQPYIILVNYGNSEANTVLVLPVYSDDNDNDDDTPWNGQFWYSSNLILKYTVLASQRKSIIHSIQNKFSASKTGHYGKQ